MSATVVERIPQRQVVNRIPVGKPDILLTRKLGAPTDHGGKEEESEPEKSWTAETLSG